MSSNLYVKWIGNIHNKQKMNKKRENNVKNNKSITLFSLSYTLLFIFAKPVDCIQINLHPEIQFIQLQTFICLMHQIRLVWEECAESDTVIQCSCVRAGTVYQRFCGHITRMTLR